MSEENANQEEGVTIPGESNPSQQRAESNGWQPLEQWVESGKDEADWVDYREFNVRGELMGKIQGMGRKLSALEQENAQLRERQRHHAEVTRDMVNKQYDKALADLKRERREALEMGDYDAVDSLDERRDELVSKRKELDEARDEDADSPSSGNEQRDYSQLHPIERTFIDIVNSDPKLAQDEDKIRELGRYADEIWGSNPDISVTEFVRRMDKHMNPPREQAPSPDGNRGGSRPRKGGSKFTKSDLSDMELEFAKTFVETGAYKDIQEYIDDAAKSGSLEVQQER